MSIMSSSSPRYAGRFRGKAWCRPERDGSGPGCPPGIQPQPWTTRHIYSFGCGLYTSASRTANQRIKQEGGTRATLSQTVEMLMSKLPMVIGEGVFEYWFQATSEDPATTAWLMRFYGVESFFCITSPHAADEVADDIQRFH